MGTQRTAKLNCPTCKHKLRCPRCDGARGGRKGGKAKVSKGFATPAVMRKAMITRGVLAYIALEQAVK